MNVVSRTAYAIGLVFCATSLACGSSRNFVITTEQPGLQLDGLKGKLIDGSDEVTEARPRRNTGRVEALQAAPGPIKLEVRERPDGTKFLFVTVQRDGQNMIVRVPLHDHQTHGAVHQTVRRRGGGVASDINDIVSPTGPTPHPFDVGPLCVSYWEGSRPDEECDLEPPSN